jgi:hypothetical protein
MIHRELMENNPYGVRRYLLLPRDELSMYDTKSLVIASINANQNTMFGLRWHQPTASNDTNANVNFRDFVNTCGPLLDIAKEDASINGQQPQALCTLNGLCDWVKDCLEKNGEGSQVLGVLMHEHNGQNDKGQEEMKRTTAKVDGAKTSTEKPRSRQRIQNRSNYTVKNESQRLLQLEAVTAIATSTPRPGHSVLGAGTYRDGRESWIHLAWEYTQTSSPWDDSCRSGLEELMCYKSRVGEVGAIEHLAHREEEYLRSAGGAMARVFFV